MNSENKRNYFVTSIFTDKNKEPAENDLKKALSHTYATWKSLCEYVLKSFPDAVVRWNFSGVKYGWSFRISDKKRVLLYLLPRDKFFRVAFVFGKKAMEEILKSDVDEHIKVELKNARPYAEGRGIRIEIRDKEQTHDIEKLIMIKIAN